MHTHTDRYTHSCTCASNLGNHHVGDVGKGITDFLVGWGHGLAVATPWGIELHKHKALTWVMGAANRHGAEGCVREVESKGKERQTKDKARALYR